MIRLHQLNPVSDLIPRRHWREGAMTASSSLRRNVKSRLQLNLSQIDFADLMDQEMSVERSRS